MILRAARKRFSAPHPYGPYGQYLTGANQEIFAMSRPNVGVLTNNKREMNRAVESILTLAQTDQLQKRQQADKLTVQNEKKKKIENERLGGEQPIPLVGPVAPTEDEMRAALRADEIRIRAGLPKRPIVTKKHNLPLRRELGRYNASYATYEEQKLREENARLLRHRIGIPEIIADEGDPIYRGFRRTWRDEYKTQTGHEWNAYE